MATDDQAAELPSFRLDGRLAVVTGAGEGIGRAFAEAFARAGARVVLAGRRSDRLDEVGQAIEAFGGHASVCPVDVRDVARVAALATHATKLAESEGLDLVLVNNAGFAFTKPALDVTEADFDNVLAVHLKGTFFCCQKIAPAMIARGYGKIINLSSTWGSSSDAGKNIYCAAKAGISQLTAALATEWAVHGIRVNAIAPTTTSTDATRRNLDANPARAVHLLGRIPLGRYASPADLVGAALYLASPASDFVTGHTLPVDGGWLAV
jgi:NAD(P)-dependent dehydrogenase (short-subunit alcohol dehydrogenase family)